MNLLEPWVLLRLVAGVVACALFARGALTAQKVLRHFDVHRATEGQLALEKRMELGATFVRIGAVVQVATLALTVLSADRLSRDVRGAMCAYGVFDSAEGGFRSLAATTIAAIFAGVLTQIYAFDGRVRAFDLARPLSALTLAMFPVSLVDLWLAFEFFGKIDLTVVASCCSVRLDSLVAPSDTSLVHASSSSTRTLATALAIVGVIAAIVVSWSASRSPTKKRVAVAGLVSLVAWPFAFAASVLEVAPHVFEVPQHVCPFCLLRADAGGIGYFLYGAMFASVVWVAGAAASALLSRSSATTDALAVFARLRLRRGAVAWMVVLALGVLPVVRYAIVSGGASLFR